MIASNENFPTFTPEEYLIWEEMQLEKHEFIDGQVYPLGQPLIAQSNPINHSRIAVRLMTIFETRLDASSGITGNSDLPINIAGVNDYLYPDISVTCDDRDKIETQYIRYPCLIVEVLSPGTEADDRGAKFHKYRQNPALIDYLLVSSTSIAIDLYHKNDRGDWLIINYKLGDIIELKSIDINFSIEQLYRNLNLTE